MAFRQSLKKSKCKSFHLKHSNTSVNLSFWSGAECVSRFISRCAVSVNITTSPWGPTARPSQKLHKTAFILELANSVLLPSLPQRHWMMDELCTEDLAGCESSKFLITCLWLFQYGDAYTGIARSDKCRTAINAELQWVRDVVCHYCHA